MAMDTDSEGLLVEAVAESMEVEQPAISEAAQPSTNGQIEQSECTGTYTWRIENFSKLPEKHYSEKFDIGTYIWRLLVFPRGNKNNFLSVFLDAPEAPYTPIPMSPRASFKLVLINHLDASKNFVKDTVHTFVQNETDWGFSQFMTLDEFYNQANGWIHNDTVELRVEVQIQKDEKYSYDSRKETGCVGLKNQGATCYMNSLIQYLYHVPYFRKAVYHMPTAETDDMSNSIPLALQSLFYKLQYSKTSVSTKDLTKSFGWSTYDAFMQHDVQELNRVLCEKLEDKMKGTKVEKVINDLFEGHTINYIQCINVDYKSQRKESFMDLQLDVKGCKDVYDSFDKYTETELLDGANQYKAEQFGLQDARKGVLFESFPPVLQLQLKRFEYDFQRDTMVKINDRYEFYDELDLDREDGRYLVTGSDRSVRNLYRLHSVLVHSGGVHGGHYYAFIRPDGRTWLKFDDERVTLEDAKRAMEEQFGGEDEPAAPPMYNGPAIKYTKFSNAYMLVYVRVSDWDRVLCDVTKEDIAEHLRGRLEQEQLEKERRQKEKQEAHLYVTIKVATDEHFRAQIGAVKQFDLVDHDLLTPEDGLYRVRKSVTFKEFKKMVAERTGVPPEKQRYWAFSRRQNGTVRPNRPLTAAEEELQLMDLRDHREATGPASKHALMDLKLYLEVPSNAEGRCDLNFDLYKRTKETILVFFKVYVPEEEKLVYWGKVYLPRNMKPVDMLTHLCKVTSLPPGSPVEMYEEIKSEPSVMVEPVDMRATLAQSELEDGDILVVQRTVSAAEMEAAAAAGGRGLRFPRVKEFLEYVRNRRLVNFRRLEEPKEEGFTLEMRQDANYDQVTEALAVHLGAGSDAAARLRLTQYSVYSHGPQRHPIKWRGMPRLAQMLSSTHGPAAAAAAATGGLSLAGGGGGATVPSDILYYEVLDMPLEQLEQLKTLRVFFHKPNTELGSEVLVRLPKESCVGDVLAEVAKQLGPATVPPGRKLRLLEVHTSRLWKVCEEGEGIESMNDTYWTLRAELVPEEDMQLSAGEQLVHVYHYHSDKDKDAPVHFGDPFLIKVAPGETAGAVRQRIQAKLGLPDEEFSKWRLAFVSVHAKPEYLQDSDEVAARFEHTVRTSATDVSYLGLEHEDDKPRRNLNSYRLSCERPVKIYN